MALLDNKPNDPILDSTSINVIVKTALHADDPIRAIRSTVFIEEQQVPAELEWDAEDQTAIHFLAQTSDGTALGTARLLATGQIGRMAVLAAYRRRGVGRMLMQAVLHHPLAKTMPRLFLHAQLSAISFYQQFGFVAQGDQYEEAGILHQTMERAHD